MRDAMPEGVSLRDLGSHGLKDFQDPEQVFQLLHPDLPSEFPPLKSLDASLHNLPTQLTSFIGRESQIQEISELFDDARCVTLTGIGGSGKTRLALEVGQHRLESYPDGVWFVDLSTITDESLVHREVASALGVQEEALSQHIQSKNMLLILDNCEHLLDICAQSASTWLAQAPNVHLLATSREALGIPGEVIRRISSLSVPDESNVSPETLMECEATRLFAERASSAHGAFEVTQENSSAIAQIANRLDGIPLAIELAAARVRMLSPEQIASRLDDRFRLLTGGSRTAMPRQRTLQAAIDWSYHSLEDEEARLFDKLSVFRGGFTLEAVEHVGVGEGDDPLYVMDALFQLVDKSLVTVAHSGSDGDARYRLLETLRHYGGERLAESGQAEDTRRMHAEYYLEMIHGVQSDLWDSGSKEAVGLLVANHDNLRGALDWALDAGETETALRLVGDLGYLWMLHRHVNEGNEKATRAFALAEQQGDAPADAMASALFAAEIVAIQLPDFERGMAYIEESIRLYREVQDDTGLARSTYARGVMPWAVGDIDQARGMLEEAISLDNLNADPWSQDWCHSLLSSIAASRGQYEGVLDTFQQTINALQSRGDYWGTAFARLMAGSVAKDLGNYSVATTHFEEGLPLARDSGDRSCLGASLSGLATTVWLRNDHERALEL
ncbi:MAG: hypothetical protein IIC24_12670, partial [Chloroflexi bacterium]|nr:hypothetical protein [Chloroflexota bacterium]